MSSFVCECSGTLRLVSIFGAPLPFNAGWDGTLKCYVSSWRDQEKKAKNYKTKQHPEGFVMIRDDYKRVKELQNIQRHREDYIKSNRPGYKFGESKKQYDKDRPDIHRTGKRVYFT